MQVQRDRPVSDQESIEIAVRDHLAGLTVEFDEWGYYDSHSLEDVLKAYNPNPKFIQLCSTIYGSLYIVRRPVPAAQCQPRTDEEWGKERVELTAKVYAAFVQYAIAPPAEGLDAIFRLQESDLRTLVEIIDRLPRFLTREEADLRSVLVNESFSEEGADGAAAAGSPSE
jgi:hypothetical protein